jgi:hypothetical protein
MIEVIYLYSSALSLRNILRSITLHTLCAIENANSITKSVFVGIGIDSEIDTMIYKYEDKPVIIKV